MKNPSATNAIKGRREGQRYFVGKMQRLLVRVHLPDAAGARVGAETAADTFLIVGKVFEACFAADL
jgi:hypothetical protein